MERHIALAWSYPGRNEREQLPRRRCRRLLRHHVAHPFCMNVLTLRSGPSFFFSIIMWPSPWIPRVARSHCRGRCLGCTETPIGPVGDRPRRSEARASLARGQSARRRGTPVAVWIEKRLRHAPQVARRLCLHRFSGAWKGPWGQELAREDFRCAAQFSVAIGGIADVTAARAGLKSATYDPFRTKTRRRTRLKFRSAAMYRRKWICYFPGQALPRFTLGEVCFFKGLISRFAGQGPMEVTVGPICELWKEAASPLS